MTPCRKELVERLQDLANMLTDMDGVQVIHYLLTINDAIAAVSAEKAS